MIVFNHLYGWGRKVETVKIEVVEKDLCIVYWGTPPDPVTKFYLQHVERRIGIGDVEIRGLCAKSDLPVHGPFSVTITKDYMEVNAPGAKFFGSKKFEFPEGSITRAHDFERLKHEIASWKIDR